MPNRDPRGLKFSFDALRTVQACALLLRDAGGQKNYTWLLKVLYLADRRSLLETGRPITGSTFVSMASGPVLSEVYACIKSRPARPAWDEHIVREGRFDVRLIKDPGDDELSDYDVRLLKELTVKHQCDDYSRMISIVRLLGEWHDPAPEKVMPLPAAEILRVEGETEATIDYLIAQNESFAAQIKYILGTRS